MNTPESHDNLVLEQLRLIRDAIGRLAEDVSIVKEDQMRMRVSINGLEGRMTNLESEMILVRGDLDRIKKRLDLVEA